ncbi:MAG: class I SAM-dependent methyltransferase [Bacteriovoracaceae bacterium]|nr:class I SAM-dependent methyltransferase [Bacteroidota bacterium]
MKLSSLIGHVTELYSDVITSSKPADRHIDFFFRSRKYLGSNDRRFIAETMYGMLRHRKRIEWIVSVLEKHNDHRYQCATYLLYNGGATKDQLSEEINISMDELVLLEQRVQTEPAFESEIATLAVTYSFQDWMIAEWQKEFDPAELVPLCSVMNTQAPMTIRVNTIKTTREECQRILLQEGLDTDRTEHSPFGLHLKRRTNLFQLQAFRDGLFEVQDEGSQLLALLVDPKPGSKVVDACAGAGGKALALASIMKNRGEIFALDVHSFRLEELKKRIRRSGVDSIRTRIIREGETQEGLVNAADNVLVDAPCSGTGTIRRNPGMKWSVTETMVEELTVKQCSILSLNAQYVKPGGKLVYATCSLMKKENEIVVEQFLASHPEFEIIFPSITLERYGVAHLANNKYFQLLPHQYNTDGFFAAILKRK